METKKKQFKMPHTFVIIGIIILLAVLLTWIIPAGSYTRFENEAGIKVIDPNDFNYIDKTPVNPLEIPLYIVKAFIKRIDLMLVIMFAGGAFHILTKTGALHAALPAADGKAHRIAVIAGDASGSLARTGLSITPSELSAAFPDTDGHWANAAVSFLKASGVTTGDDLGNFNPDSPITRQEFAVLLCRWLAPAQDTSSVELPFADNGSIADWAKDGVRAMYALGVTKGSYDGYGRLCFLPTATISRQEALTMLGRLLELGYAAPEWSFTDSDAIADWARGHINTLCAIGALSGYADGGIHPTEPITRAQVAATLFSMT